MQRRKAVEGSFQRSAVSQREGRWQRAEGRRGRNGRKGSARRRRGLATDCAELAQILGGGRRDGRENAQKAQKSARARRPNRHEAPSGPSLRLRLPSGPSLRVEDRAEGKTRRREGRQGRRQSGVPADDADKGRMKRAFSLPRSPRRPGRIPSVDIQRSAT
jgi:hypothetical protein